MTWPGLYCPVEPAAHPMAEQAQIRSVEWSTRFELAPDPRRRARLAAAKLGPLAALSAPGCPPAWLQVLADMATWWTAFDDECDDGRSTDELGVLMWPVLRAFDAPASHAETGYAAALSDLRHRIAALATPELARQFTDGLRATLLTELVRTAQTSGGAEPTYDESLATRGRSSSPAWAFPLLWHAAGCRGSAEATLADPACGVLLDLTASIINWDNDFHSYDGDRADPGNGRNLVSQVRVRLGCGEQDAIAAAVALRNEVMALFLRLRDRLHHRADPDLRRFLAGLGHYLRGNLDWHELSGRYATTGISLVPEWERVWCDPRLRTPAISWWWDEADGS
ncbi:hypothetical protein [Nocardia sp. NRRL S-836]|uniref:terpene synthase family protein n=1 Tax=Nocardia sp. NRRL S-836 TaxID=1519492 RepID=UPI000AD06083|nr:hypothetical protein [Nocardia sp. NRRL S-836]